MARPPHHHRACQPAPRVRANLPEWLFDELVKHHGEAFTAARPMHGCARRRWTCASTRSRARVKTRLNWPRPVLRAEPTPMAPAGIRLSGKLALNKLPLFVNGRSKCRMRAASCCASCWRRAAARWWWTSAPAPVARRWRWAPRCVPPALRLRRVGRGQPEAAPGASGFVQRAPGADRLGARCQDQAPAGKIDRVLVDAPCSGLGTLRRNPDLKWRQTPQSVPELSAKQSAITDSAARR